MEHSYFIFYDRLLKTVCILFKGKLDSDTYQSSLNELYHLGALHKASNWMIDTTQIKSLSKDDQDWTHQIWLEKVKQINTTKEIKLANLLSPNVFHQKAIDEINKKEKNEDRVDQKYFNNILEARKWFYTNS